MLFDLWRMKVIKKYTLDNDIQPPLKFKCLWLSDDNIIRGLDG